MASNSTALRGETDNLPCLTKAIFCKRLSALTCSRVTVFLSFLKGTKSTATQLGSAVVGS